MFSKLKPSLIYLLCFFLFACSGEPEKKEIFLSGSVGPRDLSQSYEQPIFIMVAKGSDMDKIEDAPEDYIIATVSMDLSTYEFRIDLTDKNVKAGDEVSLFAFVDRDFKNGVPYPSAGDKVGFYYVDDKLSATCLLKEGENSGVYIELNRDVFDFDARIQGKVLDNQGGDLAVVAYAGEVTSSDTDAMDYKAVIGYQAIKNAKGDVSFDMKILPYGMDVPVENVYLFALLDVNRNNEADGGDKIGYYTISEDDFPTQVTINEEIIKGINIKYFMALTDPSGYEISLTGNLVLPGASKSKSAPSYIFVAKTDNPDDMADDPASYIKYFKKIPEGVTSFDVSLSDTDLVPGDEIMIIALWDKDFNGGFPEPTIHDFIGFYMDTEAYKMAYTLKDGINSGFELELKREVFDFDAEVRGTVSGNESGDLLLVAYAGELTSFDMNALDYDKVVGYKELTKSSSPLDYTLSILPYGMNIPIENVSIFALLDVNGNGKPDSGDRIGFHTDGEDNMPKMITINEGVVENIDIDILMDLQKPSGYEMTVSGSLNFTGNNDSPVYLIVAKTDDPSTMLENPVSAIKYFEKLPEGTTDYAISLESTDLVPEDEIIVLALQDNESNGGFPKPTSGDFVGFYIDKEKMSLTYPLTDGANTGVNFDLSRQVFDFDAQVKGTIKGNDTGDMLIVAYAGELSSLDFSTLDFNKVVGYQSCKKNTAPLAYTLDILPYGMDVPLYNVYIIAFLDKNGNGIPDGGDIIGFPVNSDNGLPILHTINEGMLTGVDIEMVFPVSEPSGYTMSVAGAFEMPAGYATSRMPMFVAVTRAENVDDMFVNLISSIKGFQKMPPGKNEFNIDISNSDLIPGDEIYVVAMWDKDFKGGFPNPGDGDSVGFYMNPSKMLISTPLVEGITEIKPYGDYEFKINRKFCDINASVSFEFRYGALPNSLDNDDDGEELDPGDQVIVALIQKEGINNGRPILNMNPDIDVAYAIGFKTVTVNPENTYTINVLPVIYEEMTVEDILNDVYVIAILDENGNGVPDKGEYLGYYWRSPVAYTYVPQTVDLINGENILERSVLFWGVKFPGF